MTGFRLKKKQIHIISAVTFGNILEWYEAYSYIFLAPILSKLFFNFQSDLSNLFSAFIIFGIGFLTRPFGGLLFGLWGDRLGRKSAFLGSIILMTIPTFAMGFLSPYAKWGIFAPLSLIFLRLLQSLPESGESPGTFCFLYENADHENKRFMTSWGAFGNQLGAIIGVIEALVLDRYMSDEFLLTWGWRISFWSGGILGLLGIFLRSTLDETPIFKKMKEHHQLDTETAIQIIRNHWRTIALGTAYGVINAATFYFLATFLPTYFDQAVGLTPQQNTFVSLSMLILTTILLPVFGMMGDKFKNKPIMICCALMIILLSPPLYYAISYNKAIMTLTIAYLLVIPVTCITALIPYLITHLYAPKIRFTGVGLSFNLADGLVGGFTPAIAIGITLLTNTQAGFCWFILVCSVVSLLAYLKIRE